MLPVEDEEVLTTPQDSVIGEHPEPTKPVPIHVDWSKFSFRVPRQTSGAGRVPLKKALISAVTGKMPKVVEQLLSRGVLLILGQKRIP